MRDSDTVRAVVHNDNDSRNGMDAMDGTTTEQLSMTAAELSFLLAGGDRIRFLVGARAYRCYDITPIGADVDVREPLLAVADRFLHRHRPAVATFNASGAAGFARGVQPARAALASSVDGTWRFTAVDETESVMETFDEAAELMREELSRMLPHLPVQVEIGHARPVPAPGRRAVHGWSARLVATAGQVQP